MAQLWPISKHVRRLAALLLLLARSTTACAASAAPLAVDAPAVNFAGRLEFDGASSYSHIRIRRQGSVRSLLFVRDTGQEVLETQMDLRKPQVLRFVYLRYLFTSYLFQPQQQDALIVGLGGGSMVRFLTAVEPKLRIEAVDIDPEVIRLADKYFDVRPTDNVRIAAADGLQYIADCPDARFDAIYMDAFLKPSAGTDATGVPRELRTRAFYLEMQRKLRPGGVAAFNVNPHPQVESDVREIAAAFPQTYVFPLPGLQGLVVVGSTAPTRVAEIELAKRARDLDKQGRFSGLLNFSEMVRQLRD